jgi:hypothetical protein
LLIIFTYYIKENYYSYINNIPPGAVLLLVSSGVDIKCGHVAEEKFNCTGVGASIVVIENPQQAISYVIDSYEPKLWI